MLQHAILPMKHLTDGSRDAGCKDREHRRRSRAPISKKRKLHSLKIGSPGFPPLHAPSTNVRKLLKLASE